MRRGKPIFWLLFPWYLAIILVSMAAVFGVFRHTIHRFYQDETFAELEELARIAEPRFHDAVIAGDARGIDAQCKALRDVSHARFTVVLASGQVVGDSLEDPASMDNHAERPEIRQAMSGTVGTSIRYSRTLRADALYVAVPIVQNGQTVGVVRVARHLTQLQTTLAAIQGKVLAGAAAVAILAVVLSILIVQRLTRPIAAMREVAERFAAGELERRMPEPDAAELGDLARTMNQMASDLAARIEAVTRQRNELEAILRSMTEGVVAVDHEERLLTLNSAAYPLLGIRDADVQGKALREVVRNPALEKLVAAALQQETPVEGEIVLYGQDQERFIQVHGTALHSGRGSRIGAVLVLNDVTRLRRLENVRRDFVANVSHELRTPITSMKGFVETLLDGAVNEPENAERFLRIVLKHADRLNAIIDDLLLLAQMEQAEKDKDSARIELKPTPLGDVLDAARRTCQAKAERKSIAVHLDCPTPLVVNCDPTLLEQAVINLLDNAINYSDSGRPVDLCGRVQENEVLIEVRDQGCGISKNHLPRIFERFYRVDKARSREVGGTGLGLAIVNHIVQVHGGTVTVSSEVGQGSLFTIHLPATGVNSGPAKVPA